jgi:hypothetical protein
MPLRRSPFVGAHVTVVFLARRVGGTVEEIGDDGRRLVVLLDDGDMVAFVLSPATGRFVEEDRAVGGARLTFDDP